MAKACRWAGSPNNLHIRHSWLLTYSPLTHCSAKRNPEALSLPLFLRAVAAAENVAMASRDIVGFSSFTLLVQHAVSAFLLKQKTSPFSTAWQLRYNNTPPEMLNITAKHCILLNPGSLISLLRETVSFIVLPQFHEVCFPQPDGLVRLQFWIQILFSLLVAPPYSTQTQERITRVSQ